MSDMTGCRFFDDGECELASRISQAPCPLEDGDCKRCGQTRRPMSLNSVVAEIALRNVDPDKHGRLEQQLVTAMAKQGPAPRIARRVWNLAEAIRGYHTEDGLWTSREEYARRISICDVCEYRINTSCQKCGCSLALKAKGAGFRCPEGRWDEPSEQAREEEAGE